MSENPAFEVGETYFTAAGEKVYLDAVTTDGKFVVSQIMRYEESYDNFYEDVGPSKVVDKIFSQAPVAVLDQRFAEAQTRLAQIEKQYQTRFAEITNAERSIKDRLDKLKKYQGLELLEDFIDDKITHFVVCDSEYSTDLTIKSREDTIAKGDPDSISKWDKTLKLVTLFGKTNGDLQWRVDRYYDGSGGGGKIVWPCLSEEHGKKTIADILQHKVDEQFATATDDRAYWFLSAYEKATAFGLPQKPEVAARYAELKRADCAKREVAARKEVEKAQANLSAIVAQAATVSS